MHPCRNPNCHSYGRPHPNCKCYGYAKGGRVENFCDSKRAHSEECEYFLADGGEVPQEELSGVEVPKEDLPEQHTSGQEVPASDLPEDLSKYETTEQKIKTAVEGAAEGFLGPLAPLAETKLLGVKKEDIEGRRKANPILHGTAQATTMVGGLLTGTGEAGLIAKGAEAVAEASNLGKLGSAALKGAIEGASFTGSDEITKAMLAQPGSNPEEPVSAALLHVGAGGLVGGLGGTAFSLGEGMIGKMSEKMGKRAEDYLIKIGEDNKPLSHLGISSGGVSDRLSEAAAWSASHGNFIAYEAIKNVLKKPIEKVAEKAIGPANEYVMDGIIKSLLTHPSGVSNAAHYATQVGRGAKKALEGINACFMAGSSKIAPEISDSAMEEFKDFIANGQVKQQVQNTLDSGEGFAKGGEVPEPVEPFARVFPEQNVLLSAAKGRVSNYLNALRPAGVEQKLPFDKPSKNTDKKRSYDKAVGFAMSPLRILDHINKGDLIPEDVGHFKNLFPEVHSYLSRQMTKRITEAQLKGETPPYKKRQAMSLFLGASLDSTFTPAAIMTIQSTFMMKNQQQQQAPQKKGKGPNAKSTNDYLTSEQAREKRQQSLKV